MTTIRDAVAKHEGNAAPANVAPPTDGGGAVLALRDDQEWWSPRQLAALKAMGVKNASNEELLVFLHYCAKTRLDPFSKQIYMLERRSKNKDTGLYEHTQTIQTGIDGYRVVAQRAAKREGVHIEYEDTVWYDDKEGKHEVWLSKEQPAAARVTVVKILPDGTRLRYPGMVRFSSYAAYGKNNKTGETWLQGQWGVMGDHMIEKCQHGASWIATDCGPMRIRDIVNKRLPVKVRSIDLDTGEESWQPVVNWWKNGLTATWSRIWAPNGSRGNKPIRVTPNHHMWTPQGWRDAGELMPGDMIAVASPVLSDQQEQVILGSLLGDGSLGGRKRASSLPHLAEAHSVKQRDYALWKAVALDSLAVATAETEQSDGTGKRHPVIRMRTAAVASLYKYRGMKPEDMLGQLGPLGLAVWFMDDGGFKSAGHGAPGISSAIHCCGFPAEFADTAVAWLAARGVDAKVLRREHNPYIAVSQKGTAALERILEPWLHRDGTRKVWHGERIEQGRNGYAFVPVLRTELSVRPQREQRYDIEVANTHTMIANGFVTSNCGEAFALRRAFPNDLGGVYVEEEMQERHEAPPKLPARQRVTQSDDEWVVTGSVENDAAGPEDGAPQDVGGTEPDDTPEVDPKAAADRIGAIFREYKLSAREHASTRRAVMTGLLGDGAKPTQLVTMTELAPQVVHMAAAALDQFVKEAEAANEDVTQKLLDYGNSIHEQMDPA